LVVLYIKRKRSDIRRKIDHNRRQKKVMFFVFGKDEIVKEEEEGEEKENYNTNHLSNLRKYQP
jgi:hypothetical protein